MSTSQPGVFDLSGNERKYLNLSKSFYKSQLLLQFTIDNLLLKHKTDHVLFVTLTFPMPIHSIREAQRHLNSLFTRLRRRRQSYLWILQPHQSGRIHFHLLVPVDFDTHEGTDLDAWANKTAYSDAQRKTAMNPPLRAESDWWEMKTARHGFGRIQVAPIHGNEEAVRKYLTRMDWRGGTWPFLETSYPRFWGCSQSARCGTTKFSWNEGGRETRALLEEWANSLGCTRYEDLPTKIGPHWPYMFYTVLQQHFAFKRLKPRETDTTDAPAAVGA